jgi:hypothetical protein
MKRATRSRSSERLQSLHDLSPKSATHSGGNGANASEPDLTHSSSSSLRNITRPSVSKSPNSLRNNNPFQSSSRDVPSGSFNKQSKIRKASEREHFLTLQAKKAKPQSRAQSTSSAMHDNEFPAAIGPGAKTSKPSRISGGISAHEQAPNGTERAGAQDRPQLSQLSSIGDSTSSPELILQEPGTPQLEGGSDVSSVSISSFSSGARTEMLAVNAQLEAEYEQNSGLRLHYPAQATDQTQILLDSTVSDGAETPRKERVSTHNGSTHRSMDRNAHSWIQH